MDYFVSYPTVNFKELEVTASKLWGDGFYYLYQLPRPTTLSHNLSQPKEKS